MNKKTLIIMMIAIALFVIGISAFIYSSYKIYDVKSYVMDVNIVNKTKKLGFNVDTDGIHFGVLPRNSAGIKKVYINNTYGGTVLISIKSQGEMSNYLTINPNNFVLEPNEKKQVNFIMDSANITPGNYTGVVSIYFLRS